jgi:hypothetical protein
MGSPLAFFRGAAAVMAEDLASTRESGLRVQACGDAHLLNFGMRTHHERVQRFARDFAGVKLTDEDRPTARTWALKHPSDASAVRAMFGDALRDGLVEINPFAQLRLPTSRGRKDIVAITEAELNGLPTWRSIRGWS